MGTIDGEKLMAKLELFGTDELNDKQRKDISKWLKEQARAIKKEGNNYATRFKAAYYWLR